MNLWVRMLADLPALAQRQIARAQRISLPRACPPATRLARLRFIRARDAKLFVHGRGG